MDEESIKREIDFFNQLCELRTFLFGACHICLSIDLIRLVDEDFVSALYDSADLYRYYEYLPVGLFLYKGKTGWVAVDNSTGEAWTEGFKTKRAAVKWLHGNDDPYWMEEKQ